MADSGLPPPPINDSPGSYTWLEWYRQLRNYISTNGSVPWYVINFAGSKLTDIAIRDHDALQTIQGGTTGEHYHLTNAQYSALTAGAHNALNGLQGGAPSEYYHLNNTQHTTIDKLAWNATDGTVDVSMGLGAVTQQIGLEQYIVIKNVTGSTVTNGKCVAFSGVNSGRPTGQNMVANGTIPALYTLGVATMDIATGTEGYITTYGYVRNINTSAWSVGDVLYASPSIAGNLTSTKPTAPDLVIPVAAVITSHATAGVILVRPTISLGLSYGSFLNTTTLAPAVINTAYAATYNTSGSTSGVALGTPTSRIVCAVSGQYEVTVNAQAVKSSASVGYLYLWIRKNGTDVANSATKVAIQGSTGEATVSRSYNMSMQASDYIEVMYAMDSLAITLQANAATGFCPATSAITVTVAQINQ